MNKKEEKSSSRRYELRKNLVYNRSKEKEEEVFLIQFIGMI